MKLVRLAAVVSALALAACQAPPGPILVAVPPRPGPAQGIDLPTDSSDHLSELKDSRLEFVARYYREPTSRWPTLSASEVQRLSSLGKTIVAVWESHSASVAYFSYASGYNDAISAYRQAASVGQPAGSAIYFAVDFNAHDYDLYYIDQYFRGIAAGFAASGRGGPAYRVGVYGSGYICNSMRRAGLAQYAWLSSARAWAGYQSFSRWNIRQSGRLANLSFDHDSDEARSDYGGFRLVAYTAPAPALPPAPQPAPPLEPPLVTVLRAWF